MKVLGVEDKLVVVAVAPYCRVLRNPVHFKALSISVIFFFTCRTCNVIPGNSKINMGKGKSSSQLCIR